MLLNVPPDRRGKFHERDVENLKGYHALVKERLGHNYLKGARVRATPAYDKTQRPGYLTDEKRDTFWAASSAEAEIEVILAKPKELHYITLAEHISSGQRVKRFEVELYDGKRWSTVARGTTVGYKRILKISPMTAEKIRIRITEAKGPVVLSEISAS